MPKTTAHRMYRRYKLDGMASASGGLNGTGNDAGQQDNSVSNNEA